MSQERPALSDPASLTKHDTMVLTADDLDGEAFLSCSLLHFLLGGSLLQSVQLNELAARYPAGA